MAAFVFGLASVTVWVAAIPFAHQAPVAIAYSDSQGQGNASNVVASPQQTFTDAIFRAAQDDLAAFRFDWWRFPVSTPQPAQATSVALSSPAPQDVPTAPTQSTPTPDPTARPDPTATPRPTITPEPTKRPTARPTNPPDPTPQPTPRATAQPTPRATAQPTPEPTPSATPQPTPRPTPAPVNYSGRSHFWFPAVDIDADWSWYGCDHGGASTGLGAGVYRWGCGPASNIYMLSHAWSTFKKIRQAFHSGAMQVGQHVWYSNAQGEVTEWRVQWIRRVTDEYLDATAGEWALNDSPTPIMTLQTCDGSQNQFRIVVRLVPAD